jgi:RNA polymerase sigma factor (sigma-70 family)
MDLKEILYKIKVDGNKDYLVDFLDHELIVKMTNDILRGYKYDKADVKDSIKLETIAYVVEEYNYDDDFDLLFFMDDIKKTVYKKVRRYIYSSYSSKELPYEEFDEFVDDNGELIDKVNQQIDLSEAYKLLNDKEKEVIYLYFELEMNETEIADKLCISQQRVNVIKNNALEKIKKYLD